MYFAKAWSILSDIILHHDLWSLKAVTLMVGFQILIVVMVFDGI